MLRKKIFGGYDVNDVNETFSKMEQELKVLRSELSEVKSSRQKQDEERLSLLVESKEMREQLQKKDRDLEKLKKAVVEAQKEAAYAIDQANAIAKNASQNTDKPIVIEQRPVNYTPDYTMIEMIYSHAYQGVQSFAKDAQDKITELIERVLDELNNSVTGTAAMYRKIADAKILMGGLVAQMNKQCDSINAVLDSFGATDIQVSDYYAMLEKTKANILSEMAGGFSKFEDEIASTFSNSGSKSEVAEPVVKEVVHPVIEKFEAKTEDVIATNSEVLAKRDEPLLKKDETADAIYAIETIMIDDEEEDRNARKYVLESNEEAKNISTAVLSEAEENLKTMKESLKKDMAAPEEEEKKEEKSAKKEKMSIKYILQKYSNIDN